MVCVSKLKTKILKKYCANNLLYFPPNSDHKELENYFKAVF